MTPPGRWSVWCRVGGRGARWRLAAEADTGAEATDAMFALMRAPGSAPAWLKVAPGRPTPDADPAPQSSARKGASQWASR